METMATCPHCKRTRTWTRKGTDPGCICAAQPKRFHDVNFGESVKPLLQTKPIPPAARRMRNTIPIDDKVGEFEKVETEDDSDFDK
jgi:hypothetical protein